mmetsp:Transcript_92028/g.263668  ORF Transcript_92028/g.263668 Transcript_92028/m.263668 type:complete len:200 (-) Transcript_92028:75-674(-)
MTPGTSCGRAARPARSRRARAQRATAAAAAEPGFQGGGGRGARVAQHRACVADQTAEDSSPRRTAAGGRRGNQRGRGAAALLPGQVHDARAPGQGRKSSAAAGPAAASASTQSGGTTGGNRRGRDNLEGPSVKPGGGAPLHDALLPPHQLMQLVVGVPIRCEALLAAEEGCAAKLDACRAAEPLLRDAAAALARHLACR